VINETQQKPKRILKEKKSNSPGSKIDRVVLEPESVAFVKSILIQTQQALGAIVEITQKDIINFILQVRSQPLSEIELTKIRDQHFDMVKALQYATEQAKLAMTEGKEISVNDILKYIQTPIVIENQPSISLRGRKKKETVPPDIDHNLTTDSKAMILD
jgi:hypothetical protein